MNTQTLVVAVIMFCLIVPISAGFLMPVDSSEGVGYTTETPTNITASLNNSTMTMPVEYDSYLNNLFQYESIGGWSAEGDLTTVPNNYPALTATGAGTSYNAVNFPTFDLVNDITVYPNTQCVIVQPGTGVTFRDSQGVQIYSVLYYPDTALAYGVHFNSVVYAISTVITVEAPNGGSFTGQHFHQIVTDGKPMYLDTSRGLYSTYPTWVWTNTQVNSKVSLIIDTLDNTRISARTVSDSSVLKVNVGSDVSITFDDNTTQVLGSSSTYTKLLVVFDSSSSKVTVTGLFGVDNFTQNLNGHMGYSVSGDFDLSNIRSIYFSGNFFGSSARYYVPSAQALNSNISVMSNVTVNPTDFYQTNIWSFNSKNPGIFGSILTLTVQAQDLTVLNTYTYTVTDGKAVGMPLGGSTRDVDLRDVSIAVVPLSDGTGNAIRVNGEVLDVSTIGSTDRVLIGFDGIWKMEATLSKLTTYNYDDYVWKSGTFNIDMPTFTFIGLATAFLMSLITGFVALRYDMSGLPALGVSVLCGVIYTVLLISSI